MLCKNCIAYNGTCKISKKERRCCDLNIVEISQKLRLNNKTEKLDELAEKYYITKEENVKKQWYELLKRG